MYYRWKIFMWDWKSQIDLNDVDEWLKDTNAPVRTFELDTGSDTCAQVFCTASYDLTAEEWSKVRWFGQDYSYSETPNELRNLIRQWEKEDEEEREKEKERLEKNKQIQERAEYDRLKAKFGD